MAGKKDKIMSNKEFRELKSNAVQYVEGVKKSPDEVNALLRSGYRTPHLAEGLRYTFTPKEARDFRNLGLLGVGTVGFGFVSWELAKLAKRKFNNRNKDLERTPHS